MPFLLSAMTVLLILCYRYVSHIARAAVANPVNALRSVYRNKAVIFVQLCIGMECGFTISQRLNYTASAQNQYARPSTPA